MALLTPSLDPGFLGETAEEEELASECVALPVGLTCETCPETQRLDVWTFGLFWEGCRKFRRRDLPRGNDWLLRGKGATQ